MSLLSVMNVLNEVKQKNDIREPFEFEGVKFMIGLVTRDEEIRANSYAASYTGISNVLVLDVVLLSYAIKSINGFETTGILDDESGNSVEAPIFLRDQLMGMPSPLIDKMIGVYHVARNNLRKKLGLTVLEFDTLLEAAKSKQKDILDVNIPDVEQLEAQADQYVDDLQEYM